MNRFKAEEARKHSEARARLSDAEIKTLDREEVRNAEILELARRIHIKWFEEEYVHFYDSVADSNDRARGINPMSHEYIERVAAKREEWGVTPLSENGMPLSNDTWEIAYAEAEDRLRGHKS